MRSNLQLRYEILRTVVRNPRGVAVALALPLVIYYCIVPSNRHTLVGGPGGIPFPLYYMTGMAAYGGTFAVVGRGAVIAVERSKGWTRQLRITPLPTRAYFTSKVIAAYVMALLSLAVIYFAGTSLGVRMDAPRWFEMTGLLLLGFAPFVVMGVIVGHLITADTLPAAVGAIVVVFALLGGTFGRLFTGGAMLTAVKLLPSYWLVQAARTALGGGSWPLEGWLVIILWTAVLVPIAALVYRRDTARN